MRTAYVICLNSGQLATPKVFTDKAAAREEESKERLHNPGYCRTIEVALYEPDDDDNEDNEQLLDTLRYLEPKILDTEPSEARGGRVVYGRVVYGRLGSISVLIDGSQYAGEYFVKLALADVASAWHVGPSMKHTFKLVKRLHKHGLRTYVTNSLSAVQDRIGMNKEKP